MNSIVVGHRRRVKADPDFPVLQNETAGGALQVQLFFLASWDSNPIFALSYHISRSWKPPNPHDVLLIPLPLFHGTTLHRSSLFPLSTASRRDPTRTKFSRVPLNSPLIATQNQGSRPLVRIAANQPPGVSRDPR